MQVRNVQKKVPQLQKDGEKVLRTQMKKYPALQPYAKTPYTTYILRLGVLVPLFIFLGPLLSLIGSLGKFCNAPSAADQSPMCCVLPLYVKGRIGAA